MKNEETLFLFAKAIKSLIKKQLSKTNPYI